MAKSESSKGLDANKMSKSLAKLGDIYTGSKGAMEPKDYSRGYPPNENEHLNMNFSGKRPKGST